MRMMVDLPLPLGPSRPNTAPRSIANETWSTATRSPKRRDRPSTEMTGDRAAPIPVPFSAAKVSRPQPHVGGKPGLSFVARDERTGEAYLRLPVPSPEVLEQALAAFGKLLEGLRK